MLASYPLVTANTSLFYSIEIIWNEDSSLTSYSDVFKISEATSEGDVVNTSTSIEPTTTAELRKPDVTSSSTTTGTPTADTTTTGSLLPSESSTPSSKGLSTGAAAGIGVGTTLGALILLGIGVFFWWRGRKRSLGPENSAPESGPETSAPASALALETTEYKNKTRASGLEGTGVIPAELLGTPRAELPS
ncbi:hypothetical protein VE03_09657 [Pseudogymnoascus sp. 23342-1-I1]|nr:hypothetical protein VE03_09657 [Pseudogymnoascus sp. 23342-1-I1]